MLSELSESLIFDGCQPMKGLKLVTYPHLSQCNIFKLPIFPIFEIHVHAPLESTYFYWNISQSESKSLFSNCLFCPFSQFLSILSSIFSSSDTFIRTVCHVKLTSQPTFSTSSFCMYYCKLVVRLWSDGTFNSKIQQCLIVYIMTDWFNHPLILDRCLRLLMYLAIKLQMRHTRGIKQPESIFGWRFLKFLWTLANFNSKQF